MIKKIFWTVYCLVMPIAGISLVIASFTSLFDTTSIWTFVVAFVGFIMMAAPGWFMWKGTKLLPLLSILPIRIVSFILGLIFFPVGCFFSLWGIWIKS